jgi:transcriptional regulator with XRE-family HTH domain
MDQVETDPRVRRGLEIIGRAVWEARRRAGISQRQLAYLAGVHQSTISRLERGRLNGMRLQRLAAIVAVLDQLSFIEVP